ncbi:hypothetical protein [Nostoc sp.]|uniref:hypothetical protein n=1 Tax=Nostoc sp. TaxID=1180 RepID=UPI002FF761C5
MSFPKDLTLDQIRKKCDDNEVAGYIACMSPLPKGINLATFLANLLHAAHLAQTEQNISNTGKKKLVAYPEPIQGEDTVHGIMREKCKSIKCEINITVGDKTNKILPAYE